MKCDKRFLWPRIYWCLSLSLSILMGLLYMAAFPIADDLWFSIPGYEDASISQCISYVGEVWCRTIFTDMLRLGNMLVPVATMVLPRWIVAIIYTLLSLLSVEGCRRLLSLDYDSVRLFLLIVLFFLILPWYDYLLATSYMLNYLLSTALIVWSLYFFDRISKSTGARTLTAGLILFFFAGWCHEGFAVPALCGMGLVWLIDTVRLHHISRRKILFLVSMMLGVAVIFCGSSFGTRSQTLCHAVANMPRWEFFIQLGPSLFLLIIAAAFSVAPLVRGRRSSLILMLLISAMAAEAVAICFYSGPRTTWPASLYSLLTIIALLPFYFRRPASQHFKVVAVFAVMTLVGGHLVYAIYLQTQLTEQYGEVIDRYRTSENGEVYADISKPKIDASLLKTTVRILNDYHSLQFISLYNNGNGGVTYELKILPSALEYFTPQAAKPLDTGSGDYVYEGMAVTSDLSLDRKDSMTISFITEDGKALTSRCRAVLFHAHDGQSFLWLKTHAQTISPDIRISRWSIWTEPD